MASWTASALLAQAVGFLVRRFHAQETKNWRNQQRDSQTTIRVTADLVLVPVTVTESSGKPVLGLEKQDFVLTDDKVAQEILLHPTTAAGAAVKINGLGVET